jgi:hypothetical protein
MSNKTEEEALSRRSADALQAASDRDRKRRMAELESRRMRWRKLKECVVD